MAVNDEIKAERAKMKDRPFKEKLAYFWDYYKIHTIVGIVVIIGLCILIRDIREGSKPVYLDATFINTNYPLDTSELSIEQDYIEQEQINPDEYNMTFDFSMSISIDPDAMDEMSLTNRQKLMALYSAQSIDILAGPVAVMNEVSGLEAYDDLEVLLPEDLKNTLSEKGYEYYYYTGEDGREIAGGIFLDNCDYLKSQGEFGLFLDDGDEAKRPLLTVAVNSPNKEHAISFIRMIVEN